MRKVEKILGIAMLLFAIGFNLWIYRLEPTAKIDPNDNTFQYALVDRTNQMWDYANKKCSEDSSVFFLHYALCTKHYALLFDHWVPNWAEGYNLPYYYSHLPQITIVASWRLFNWIIGLLDNLNIGLFSYYHWIIYLLLSFFPLSVFLALRITSLSFLSAGFGAIIATQLSTDGLYGLDPPSFLWRGYGLSSQLFAMIWLPLAIAYGYRVLSARGGMPFRSIVTALAPKSTWATRGLDIDDARTTAYRPQRDFIIAILTLAATTAGHLGIGIIAFLSVAVVGWKNFKQLLLIYGGTLLLLSYWIIPILTSGNYHNISVWDPVWKFDSYGARETIIRLLNGDLFDFGRLPILTALVFVGLFSSLSFRPPSRNPAFEAAKWTPDQVRGDMGMLFLFWLLMYFGRTTWGPLIDLIPGMKEFHLSRFIVGVQLAGLFLIPMAIKRFSPLITLISLIALIPVYQQTIRYASYNDVLIKQANENFSKVESDADSLRSTLYALNSTSPGRVFAGRGGSWGRDFRIAETPYYMYLSTYGIPTVLWLPETWSPNSDIEQYFSEDQAKDYMLYNIRYVVAPSGEAGSGSARQPFWKKIKETNSWILYSLDLSSLSDVSNLGYITTGIRPAIVSTSKENFINVVRLWIQSDYHRDGLYPELTFANDYPRAAGLPNFRMVDEVTYRVPDGTRHNLFAEVPRYAPPSPAEASAKAGITLLSQSSDTDMLFRATVDVPEGCTECLVILKQTFHPSWGATIDGKPARTLTVFPFYTAVKLESSGTHEVVFSYKPSGLKIGLLVIGILALAVFVGRNVILRK